MIKQRASDIVKRALQIADLTNSDFISDMEKIQVLNEAYTDMYNKVISHGSNDFVKKIYVSVGENYLPDDFYRLKSVGVQWGNNIRPIKRRNGSTGFYSYEYELNGSVLYIYGNVPAPVLVEYYPEPATLTYTLPSKTVYENAPMSAWNDWYAYNDKIYNIKDSTIELDPQCEVDVILKDCFVVSHNDDFGNNHKYVRSYDDPENDLSSEYINTYLITESGDLYNFRPNDPDGFYVHNCYGLPVQGVEFSFDPTMIQEGTIINTNDDLTDWYWFNVDGDSVFHLYHNGIEVWQTYEGIWCVYADNGIYFLNPGNLYKIEDSNVSLVKQVAAHVLRNFDTGYGLVVNNKAESHFPDTILDFTNSLFFSYLSYLMALKFKQKQDAPTEAIENALVAYEETLFASLSSDISYPTITNVY